jgi:uncharacterized membrane protein
MGGMMAGLSAIWWIGSVLVCIVAAALVVAVARARRIMPSRQPRVAGPPSAALAELDARYARGEMTSEVYLERRSDLAYSAKRDIESR